MNTLLSKLSAIIILIFLAFPTNSFAELPNPLPPCDPSECEGATPWQTTVIQVTTMPGVPAGCPLHVGYTWRKCNDRTEINGFNFTFDSTDPDCAALYDSIYNNPSNRANFLRDFYMALPGAIAKQLAINFHNAPGYIPGSDECPDSKEYYDFNIGACMSFYGYKTGTLIPFVWVQPFNCSQICCKWTYDICFNTDSQSYSIHENRYPAAAQTDCNSTGMELPPNQYEIFRTPCSPICSDGH